MTLEFQCDSLVAKYAIARAAIQLNSYDNLLLPEKARDIIREPLRHPFFSDQNYFTPEDDETSQIHHHLRIQTENDADDDF